jgi:hypothetical protein
MIRTNILRNRIFPTICKKYMSGTNSNNNEFVRFGNLVVKSNNIIYIHKMKYGKQSDYSSNWHIKSDCDVVKILIAKNNTDCTTIWDHAGSGHGICEAALKYIQDIPDRISDKLPSDTIQNINVNTDKPVKSPPYKPYIYG